MPPHRLRKRKHTHATPEGACLPTRLKKTHPPLTLGGHHEKLASRRYCCQLPTLFHFGLRWRRRERIRQMDGPGRPDCVPLSAIQSVSKVMDLTAEQFEFVRALYVAIPPVSKTLPPGDHAVVASSDGSVMVALIAQGQACARFLAPDFIQAMLIQVGQRVTVELGTPL